MEGQPITPYALDLTLACSLVRIARPEWGELKAFQAVAEVLAWVGLKQRVRDTDIVPPRPLYGVITALTEVFKELCGAGPLVEPPEPYTPEEGGYNVDGYAETYRLYSLVYGRPAPLEFWPLPVIRRLVFDEPIGKRLRE